MLIYRQLMNTNWYQYMPVPVDNSVLSKFALLDPTIDGREAAILLAFPFVPHLHSQPHVLQLECPNEPSGSKKQ